MPRLTTSISGLFLALAVLTGCARAANPPLAAQIDAVFRNAHDDGEFNGNVLVTRGDAVIYQGSFGLADHARNIANTTDTKFLAFSVNKPITAILVFQLIESGKVRLDDRLDHFFPNLAGRAAGAISLRQLLTHTSGIEEIISRHRERRISARDLEAAVVKNPGSHEYSSSAFVCLALVLEAVTSRTYAELLEEGILRPAGMNDSGLLRSEVPVAGLAIGYRAVDGHDEVSPLGIAPEVMEGAGSLYTTVGDLRRFDQALSAAKILSTATQQLMMTPQSGDRGFGWSLGEQGGKYFPWHQGSYRGFTAILVRQIHRHEMIAILSNSQDTDVLGLRTKVLRLLKSDAQSSETRP